MRHIFFLSALLFGITAVRAECSSSGIYCWPNQRTISRNAIFVITLYGSSQNIASELADKKWMYLKSGSDSIQLTLLEVHQAEFDLTQVILKPGKTLTAGKEYQLLITRSRTPEPVTRWDNDRHTYVAASWMVVDRLDSGIPQWTDFPKLISKTMVMYGCGPAKWVNFSCNTNKNNLVLVRATVKSLKTKRQTVYYLQPENDQIKVGHGMCSGAFHFDAGDDYEVSFALLDQSGNSSLVNPKPYRFSRPSQITQAE